MTFTLKRGSFPLSLIALGAQYTLGSDATARQVNEVWKEALAKPWFFEVSEYGTITETDYPQNETWGEIFNTCSNSITTPESVIAAVRNCQPLNNRFQVLAEHECESLVEELSGLDNRSFTRRRHIQKVIAALEADTDEGWIDWVRLEGKAGVERFRDEIASGRTNQPITNRATGLRTTTAHRARRRPSSNRWTTKRWTLWASSSSRVSTREVPVTPPNCATTLSPPTKRRPSLNCRSPSREWSHEQPQARRPGLPVHICTA